MAIEDIGINITKEVIVAIVAWMKKPIVTVIALNKHNIPVKGVTVTLNNRSEKTVGSGKAIFEELTAGKYTLSVKYGEKKETELEIIYLEAGEKATITLTLPDSLFEPAAPIPEPPPNDSPPQSNSIERDSFELFITELATFVHINANGDIEMTEPQKVKDTILKTPQNLGAAFLVVQSLDEIKRDLLKQFLENLKNQLKAKKYYLIWDTNLTTAKRSGIFGILFNEQQDKYLGFQFDKGGFDELGWGIIRKDKNVVISSEARNEIFVIMENKFKKARKAEWWPWWAMANEIELQGFENWSSSPVPWQAMQDGTLANKIVGIADKVHAAFKDRMDLLMLIS